MSASPVSFFDQISNFVTGGSTTKDATPLHHNSVRLLVTLLKTKNVDMADTLPLLDGSAVTYQQILDSRVENADRPWIGDKGTIYELAHKLSSEEASLRITELKKLPAKAGSSFNGGNKKSSAEPKNSSDSVSREEFNSFQELMLNGLKAILSGQQPEAVEGHTTSTDSSVEEVAEEIAIDVSVGDVLRIRRADGSTAVVQLVERTNGSFGCNKTIV